jgi:hypothetical protein
VIYFKEPLLFNKQTDKEIYRFTWLRSFHNAITIRIEKNDKNIQLFWKVCDGVPGYSGKLLIDTVKSIKSEEWDLFQSKIGKINFWNIGLYKKNIMVDGSFWILEALIKKNITLL